MTDDDRVGATAELIWDAWCRGERLADLPAAARPREAAEAMAAQAALATLASGSYGWKLAATSPAGQAHIGVDGPLPGPLLTRRATAAPWASRCDAVILRIGPRPGGAQANSSYVTPAVR